MPDRIYCLEHAMIAAIDAIEHNELGTEEMHQELMMRGNDVWDHMQGRRRRAGS